MATIATLDVRISATTAELAAGMKRAVDIVSSAMARISALGAGVSRTFSALGIGGGLGIAAGMAAVERNTKRLAAALGIGGGLGITAGMAAVGRSAISLAADLEQAQIAFATMLGSAQKADAFLRDLANFAASTPFQFHDLQDAARRMLAYGFEASKVLPIMTSLGNAVAALGGGSEMINRVILAIGQMRAKGRVAGEEMRQLAETGLPVWDLLAAKIGVSIPEAMKAVEKGAVDAETGIAALIEGLDARFTGAMERQSKTIAGLWSTAKDNISLTLREIGEQLITTFDLRGRMQGFVQFLDRIRAAIESGGIRGGLRHLIGDDWAAVAETLATKVLPAIASVARGFAQLRGEVPLLSAAISSVPLILDIALSGAAELIKRVSAGLAALPGLINWAIASAIATLREFQAVYVAFLKAQGAQPGIVGAIFNRLARPFDLAKILEDVAHWRDEANRAALAMEATWNKVMGIEERLPEVAETATATARESIIRITTSLGDEIKGKLAGGFGRGGQEGAEEVKRHISSLREYAAANPVVVRVRYQEETPFPGVRVSVPAS